MSRSDGIVTPLRRKDAYGIAARREINRRLDHPTEPGSERGRQARDRR